MPLTSIVIVTRNGLDLTRRCIESIQKHTPTDYELIIVDNASNDGTQEYIRSLPGTRWIRNQKNRGFAAACNQGMAAAEGDYIVLLNNDTIVTPGWLTGLQAWLMKDETIGMVGPMSNHVAPIQRDELAMLIPIEDLDNYARHRKHVNGGRGFFPHRLIGFCLMFHRELLDQVGGLDERFVPGNYEDDDFSIRVRISGKKLWVAQDVFVHHEGQATFKINGINYAQNRLKSAEIFCRKWSVGISPYEIDRVGYNPSEIVEKEPYFLRSRHYVPLIGQN